MATPLDTELIGHFEVIFPFLFVLVITYGILASVKVLGDNKGIKGMVAFVFAIMMLFSPIARETINTAAPWFVLLFVFILMSVIAYMTLGATSDDIHGVITGGAYGSTIGFWILGLILIITIGSLTSVVAKHGGIGTSPDTTNNTTATTSEGQTSDFWSTLFHPKVLGLILIMMISMFTLQRLVKD